MKCKSCGAPLKERNPVCDYCSTKNDIDLTSINYYTENAPDEPRLCPRCEGVVLATINLELEKGKKFYIERCDECLGLFFDTGELEHLLEASVKNVYTIDYKKLYNFQNVKRHNEYKPGYIKCPVCSKLMTPVNFSKSSGVIVDRCKDHGIWLDGGELNALLEWMKAGGMLLHKQKEVELEKLKQKKEEKKRAQRFEDFDNYNSNARVAINGYTSTLRKSDSDVFDKIMNVMNRFF